MPDEWDEIADAAIGLIRRRWEGRRSEMILWLIDEKKFSRDGARKCVDGFIEAMVFVAETDAKVAAANCRKAALEKTGR